MRSDGYGFMNDDLLSVYCYYSKSQQKVDTQHQGSIIECSALTHITA